MDTVPQPQGDQMPLGSRASIPSDDRLTTHATGVYRKNYLKSNVYVFITIFVFCKKQKFLQE